MADVKLPELGEGVTEGELIKWLVKPGDAVKPDQPIAEIMTDKATVEVPSPIAGTVKELKFKAGDVIKVENVMITLDGSAPSATTSAPAPKAAPMAATPAKNMTTSAPAMMAAPTTIASTSYYPPVADSRVLATPSTRRLAREVGVDINGLSGSGLAGRVTREDVITNSGRNSSNNSIGGGLEMVPTAPQMSQLAQLARSIPGSAQTEERVAIRGVRKKIVESMQMSKRTIPHFTLMDEADVTALVALRESLKDYAEKSQTKITYLPFVIKAMIATIREFPMLNASIDDNAQEIVYKKYFNIGFAADTPNGLVVPVIKNADQKTILELSREILDLSKRARDGKLKLEEMKGATITVTNIGSVGGAYATPIINHPEVAIFGMYKIQDKIILGDSANGKNGTGLTTNDIKVIKTMNFTVTADHRLIDGAVAANFLKSFMGKIQNPGRMMMEML
jgi:pyruvate dehydrogenase E2 component (dihydrolipoamide acetyltransferase)